MFGISLVGWDPGTVGILPCGERDQGPVFDDSVLELPKLARRNGYDVVFAGTDDPHFLTEYSAGDDFATIGVVLSHFANAGTIAIVRFVVTEYLKQLGWGRRSNDNPQLTLKIARVGDDGTLDGVEMNGDAASVLEALDKVLNG